MSDEELYEDIMMRDFAHKITKEFAMRNACRAEKRESGMLFGGGDIYDSLRLPSEKVHVASVLWKNGIQVVTIQEMTYILYNIGDPDVERKILQDLYEIKKNKWIARGIKLNGEIKEDIDIIEAIKPTKQHIQFMQDIKKFKEMIFLNTFKD